jgi:type I restriction enzyme S subunit
MLKFRRETEFKESEIGEIPKDWDVKKLKDLAKLVKGVSYKSSEIDSHGKGILFITLNNFLRGGGFKKEFDYYVGNKIKEEQTIVKGDLIIALTDMTSQARVVGAPAIVNLPEEYEFGVISLDCAKIIPKVELSKYYLYSYLKVSQEENATFANGVNVLHLNVDLFIQDKLILYPPPFEQSCIATVLSWFDDLIDNKERQNEVLEKTAMAIFKSWFMDFEPFKHEEFVDSPLGEIPGGWNVKPIGELAEIRNGLSYSGKEKFEEPVDGSYVFITLNNAIEGGGFKPVYAWIKSDRIKEHHFLREGDLIIPNTEQTKDERLLGSPGIVFFPPGYEIDKGVYSMDIVKISPRERYYTFFLYLYLMFTREESASFHSGTSVLHFDINNFRKNKMILCPPLPILEKFHFLVEPLFQKIIKNQKQIMVLSKVRDVLLPLLVFGRLRVEEI